ncbi:response regulator transcription factor [Myroides sp. LJL119]
MPVVAIIEQQELTRYAFTELIDSLAIPNLQWCMIDSANALELYLQRYPKAFVILNPESFHVEHNKEIWLSLSKKFLESKWMLVFDNLNLNWRMDLSKYNYTTFSIVNKNEPILVLKQAFEYFFENQKYLSQQIQYALKEQDEVTYKVEQVLTMVEREILREICFGKMNKEIALERHISIHTVVTHRKNIFKKLGVNSAYEATKYAIKSGIITVNDYYI